MARKKERKKSRNIWKKNHVFIEKGKPTKDDIVY